MGQHLKRNQFWGIELHGNFLPHLYWTQNDAKKGIATIFGSPWAWVRIRDATDYHVVRVEVNQLR